MRCASCGGGPLIVGRARVGRPVAERHAGRGLCGCCYERARRAGRLADWPRAVWDGGELVAEAELVAARQGGSLAEVAATLGVSRAALERARSRHRHLVA